MKQLILTLLMIISLNVLSQTTTAIGSGSWNSSIWDNGVPTCLLTNKIVIPDGVIVDIKNSVIDLSTCNLMIIIEDGGILELERTGNGGNEALLQLGSLSSIKFEGTGKITAVSNKTNMYSTIVVEIGGQEVWNGSQTRQVLSGPGYANALTLDGVITSPLPVDLLSFNSFYDIDQVSIKWATASEINNDYFILQRSVDGSEFDDILLTDGHGTTNTLHEYTAADCILSDTIVYYRLLQVDYDGQFEYSHQISLDLSTLSTDDLLIIPNPSYGKYITLHNFKGSIYDIEVLDAQGRKVRITNYSNDNQITFGVQLKKGYYFLKVEMGSDLKFYKFIVQ